ncbi:pancreatic secretory granule membrane major glycoprotein GP2-like [Periophthalmus magnuspinnatus]|uniref:pancreatic secretory granule membrane major glycoprotein GP2-like n=1 Tax=Periophthalmus magnuspinnatus TaxID=409849 RepID=UPI002436376B|nr:pancreatic secretory granule membrane major glycoprotein GP2-like [Periophthalmus magnuspinnatus]
MELLSVVASEEPETTEFLFLTQKKPAVTRRGPSEMLQDTLPLLRSFAANNVSIQDGVIHWTGADECLSNPCPRSSICLNTLGSFRCLCRDGYYDVSAFSRKPTPASPACNDKGMFSHCLGQRLMGGISKLYLRSQLKGALKVSLNQGLCEVNETEDFYFFKIPRDHSQCGTRRWVNTSHIELQNLLTVSGGGGRGAKVRLLWKCVYPRHYLRTAQVGLELDRPLSFSIVVYNSSLKLPLTMGLYKDHSYGSIYTDAVTLSPDDTLYFEVALQTSHAFIHNLRLQVESCWATESPDSQDPVQGMFLQDSCPVDDTFSWRSKNGAYWSCRFSIRMFLLPLGQPLYFHCRAAVCGPQENCYKNCSDQRRRRSASPSYTHDERAAVVSVGPLVVTKRRASLDKTSHWSEHMTVITVVAGSIGLLAVTLFFVSAIKAVMKYYEQFPLK